MKKFILNTIVLIGCINGYAQSWNITGNSGTNPPTNFLGTTDNKALVFKTNNTEWIRILSGGNFGIGTTNPLQKLDVNGNINIAGGFGLYMQNQRVLKVDSFAYNTFLGDKAGANTSTARGNTGMGYSVLLSNSSGADNTANGFAALYHNTTGYYNTAMGYEALYENGFGFANTAVGINALGANTTGHDNTAMGRNALFNNISGFSNVAIGTGALYQDVNNNNLVAVGDSALYSNNTGIFNTAIGSKSLYSNSGGTDNTASGYNALYSNNTGQTNTATGSFALYSNTDGFQNTANGAMALYYNTGYDNTANGASALYYNNSGHNNTATGENALYYNTSGSYNVASGQTALFSNTAGVDNTAAGAYAMSSNTGGNYNTAVGYAALNYTTTAFYNTSVGYYAGANYNNGYNNVFLGAQTDVNGAGYYNVVAVGHSTLCTASSQVRIGNSATTSIGGYANWSNISDVRVKKNIKQNVPGLAFINKLQPITYNLNLEAADKITQPPIIKNKDGKQIQPTQQDLDARKAKEQIVYTGFAAQDVEKAAKSLNYDFSGVDAAKNDKDLYGLRYAEFVVPLVKAVQELSVKNDSKDSIIEMQNNKMENLESRLAKLESMMNINLSITNSLSTVNNQLSTAFLEQNIPNPFSGTTTINYTLPQHYASAEIIITGKNGSTLKQISLSNKGKGSVTVDASTLASGAYQYSLIVNGKMISTKQMERIK